MTTSEELFKDYDDIKAEESLLFQKKNFDLDEENSCLKEVNMRLRFAQVKNVYGGENSVEAGRIKTKESDTNRSIVYPVTNLSRLPIRVWNILLH